MQLSLVTRARNFVLRAILASLFSTIQVHRNNPVYLEPMDSPSGISPNTLYLHKCIKAQVFRPSASVVANKRKRPQSPPESHPCVSRRIDKHQRGRESRRRLEQKRCRVISDLSRLTRPREIGGCSSRGSQSPCKRVKSQTVSSTAARPETSARKNRNLIAGYER